MPTRPSTGPAAPPAAGFRLLRLLTAATLLLPLLVLIAGGTLAWRDQQAAARAALGRLIDVGYEHATKIFDTDQLLIRQMLLLVGNRDDAAVRADEAQLHVSLGLLRSGLPQVKNLLVFGADGAVVATANQPPGQHDVSAADRDFFLALRAGQQALISRTLASRLDGLPFFAVLQRREDASGRFAGAVAVAIDPQYFVDYFHALAVAAPYGEGMLMTLRRADDTLLVSYPPAPPRADVAAWWPIPPALRQAIQANPPAGETVLPADPHSSARLVSWRRLQDTPLTLIVAIPRGLIVRHWKNVMVAHLYFGVPATVALFGLSLLVLHSTRVATAAAAQALQEARRREQAELAAHEAQKMEALGKLTGGIAHDFNNLLAVIMGNAELALRRPPDRARRLLEGIISAAQRGERLTRQFLAFTRHRPAAARPVDLQEMLPRVVEMLQPVLRSDVQVKLSVPAALWPVHVDPGELEIALLNLAINARDAMPLGGDLRLIAMNVPAAETAHHGAPIAADCVALTVADTGEGMPPDVRERAFEPFFTTKAVGVGTGLGLSQVYAFAQQSGGAAVIDSQAGRGTAVTLLLPRVGPGEAAGTTGLPAAAERDAAQGPARRVLLLEDNEEVAEVTAALLRGENCEVDIADRVTQAEALLKRMAASGRRYDLILADVVIPGASGIDFAHAVRLRWPDLPVVLVTGFTDQTADVPPGVPVVGKPLRLADFRRLLESAAAEAGLSRFRT